MNAYTFASITLEIFAIMITALLLLSGLMAQWNEGRQSRVFLAMLVVNGVALICDLFTWVFEGPEFTALIYAANFFVFSLGYFMTCLFTTYIASFISREKAIDRWLITGLYGLGAVAVILVIVSLFNGMYFYVEDGSLQAGRLGWLSVAISMVMILGDMVLMLIHRREFGRKNTAAFLSYGVFPVAAFFIQLSGTELTVTWLASTLTMLLIYLVIHVEHVRRLEIQQAELMISQIQPHFLYNSLTVVDQLIRTDPPEARRALADFSTYLRCNLSSLNRTGLIPFTDELKHIRAYLDLEQIRYGEYLRVEFDIEARDFDIPTLSVQPLVENAVQHGLADKEDGGTVRISTREMSDRWVITVEDDGVGFAPGEMKGTGEHIGIDNIRTRLSLMCGGKLRVSSEVGEGTLATVTIYKDHGEDGKDGGNANNSGRR